MQSMGISLSILIAFLNAASPPFFFTLGFGFLQSIYLILLPNLALMQITSASSNFSQLRSLALVLIKQRFI